MDANIAVRALNEVKLTLSLRKNLKTIKNILAEPSLYADMPRKSYRRRLYENIKWYLLHGEPNRFYNSYGFDIIGFRNQDEYLPYRNFRIQRNNENYKSHSNRPYDNQTIILRDKILFSAYLGKMLGSEYVVETLGYIEPDGRVFDLHKHSYSSLSDMAANCQGNLFVKKLYGECGDGCYVLNRKTENIEALASSMIGAKYIIQPCLEQHQDISRINPSCVNTIRIVTIWGKKSKKAAVLASLMRFGVDSIKDNRATGGFSVAISDDGILGSLGIAHHYITKKHPVSGVVFDGIKVPYYDQVKELVRAAHALIPQVISIGWDVAITKDGPVLLEGNDNWEICGPQDMFGGLKKKWYELHRL